jgi:GT2 family glycosyltransferase
MKDPLVSIVVCTRNRPEHIETCIQSLLEQQYHNIEVVIVDQSSSTESYKIIQRLFGSAKIKIRYTATNSVGLSKARNIGIKYSSGEIVAFTDDDVIADKNWILNMVNDFHEYSTINCIFGKVLPLFYGKSRRAICTLDIPNYKLYSHTHLNPYGVGVGNNMSFRKELINIVGSFDERFGVGSPLGGADDIDYIYRVFLNGFDILYSPEVVVYHKQWKEDETLNEVVKAYHFANAAFITKHLIKAHPGILVILLHRLWHHALKTTFEGVYKKDRMKIIQGLQVLRDHVNGAAAYVRILKPRGNQDA